MFDQTSSIETATLIAAGIAAFASIINILVGLMADRAAESRTAHRDLLAPHLADISEFMYSTVACSKVLTEAKTDPAVEHWRQRAEKAKEALKAIRVRLRYPLWGITDQMNTLTRLPDWIEHARPLDPRHSRSLFAAGRNLASWLDRAVRASYRSGRPPSLRYTAMVSYYERRLQAVYKTMKADRPEAA